MADYTVVHNPDRPHKCKMPNHSRTDGGQVFQPGAILMCDECGKYWMAHPWKGNSGTQYYDWEQVRWWHLRTWKRINAK